MIWKKEINLDELNNAPEYIGSFLGIKFTEWNDNALIATMPVNKKTHQPWGILHGGASVVLAETLGSYASTWLISVPKMGSTVLLRRFTKLMHQKHYRLACPKPTFFIQILC